MGVGSERRESPSVSGRHDMLTIRRATANDCDAVAGLWAEVLAWLEGHRPGETPPTPADSSALVRHLKDLLADEDALFIVAEEGNGVLGFLFATFERVPDDVLPAPRVEIGYVAVRESHRRKGVGRALMREAQRWAAERGTRHVALAVWEFNQAAIRLYEDLGFQTVERRMLLNLPRGPEQPDREAPGIGDRSTS